MKKCICCGTQADAAKPTCANCGEGSWSNSSIVILRSKDEPSVPELVSPSIATGDPDTSVEVPRVRRGKRPN